VTRVERLADLQRRSHAQLPSIREPLARREVEPLPDRPLAAPMPVREPELVP